MRTTHKDVPGLSWKPRSPATSNIPRRPGLLTGPHESGRPYYAMRFIKGENLKPAVDRFHQGRRGLRSGEWAVGLGRCWGFLDLRRDRLRP